MYRRRTTVLLLTAAFGTGVALLGGACSPAAAPVDVATAGGAAPGAGTTVPDKPATDPKQAALDFARCMREHGVDMPDPEVSEEGGIGITVNGGPGSPDAPAMKAAEDACQPALDAAVQQGGRNLDPAEEARMRENALKFSQCMRDHGVDMPDPTFEGNGKVTSKLIGPGGGGPDPDSPVFQDAEKACESLVEGGPGLRMRKGPPPGASSGEVGK